MGLNKLQRVQLVWNSVDVNEARQKFLFCGKKSLWIKHSTETDLHDNIWLNIFPLLV